MFAATSNFQDHPTSQHLRSTRRITCCPHLAGTHTQHARTFLVSCHNTCFLISGVFEIHPRPPSPGVKDKRSGFQGAAPHTIVRCAIPKLVPSASLIESDVPRHLRDNKFKPDRFMEAETGPPSLGATLGTRLLTTIRRLPGSSNGYEFPAYLFQTPHRRPAHQP